MRAGLCLLLVAVTAGGAAARPSPGAVLRAPDQLAKRVIAVHRGPAGLTAATTGFDLAFDHGDMALSLPLYQERADVVRVVAEADDARLLVWLRRSDLAWTVARATRIAGRGDVGVWVLPGAPLTVDGAGQRVAVRVVADDFAVDGAIDRSALVHAHVPRPGVDRATHSVRVAILRSPGGPPLVTPDAPIGVRVIDHGPRGWVLVEHAEARARVVGWVQLRDLGDLVLTIEGFGSGSGIGRSHTPRIEVDAGACMFGDDGAVVGLQLRRTIRYAQPRDGGAWTIYVSTPWGTAEPRVIDRAPSGETARWTPCP